MPVRKGMDGSHPNILLISALSLLRPLTPLGAFKLYRRFNLNPGNVFDDIDKLIDGDLFSASQIDRQGDRLASHDVLSTLETIVDVHEAPCLLPLPQISILWLPLSFASKLFGR